MRHIRDVYVGLFWRICTSLLTYMYHPAPSQASTYTSNEIYIRICDMFVTYMSRICDISWRICRSLLAYMYISFWRMCITHRHLKPLHIRQTRSTYVYVTYPWRICRSLLAYTYISFDVYVSPSAISSQYTFIGKVVFICLRVSVNLVYKFQVYKFQGKPGTTTVKHDFNPNGVKFHRGSPWVSILNWLNLKANKDYFSYEHTSNEIYIRICDIFVTYMPRICDISWPICRSLLAYKYISFDVYVWLSAISCHLCFWVSKLNFWRWARGRDSPTTRKNNKLKELKNILCVGCLIFVGHFPQKRPIISGSFAKKYPQLLGKAVF